MQVPPPDADAPLLHAGTSNSMTAECTAHVSNARWGKRWLVAGTARNRRCPREVTTRADTVVLMILELQQRLA